MKQDDTEADIAKARQHFDTVVTEPNPKTKHKFRRKIGYVTARKRGTEVIAGNLNFGTSKDAQGDLVVRTTLFETVPDFEGQHVALLLAFDLREHYGVDALSSTGMERTVGGAGVLASLRRRGIMEQSNVG